MKIFPLAVLSVWAVLWGAGLAQAQVRVVAAADLQYALTEIARAFEAKNPGIKVSLSFGSSGKFYTQLVQGLEADLYFSAERLYPELLEKKGLAEAGTRRPYAIGRMVIWLDRKLGLEPSPEALKDPRITRLAIANPVHAPYGRAAVTLLEHYGLLRRRADAPLPGLKKPFPNLSWEEIPWERLSQGVEAYWDATPLRQGKPRFEFVYGENISHTAQLALSATQAGILALSLAVHESLSRPGVYWLAPLGSHLALEQDYVILKGRKRPEVMAFYTFVGSPEARRIFQRYGFLLPGEKVETGLPQIELTPYADAFAEAILTTDLVPKVAEAEVEGARIVGIAKGSGMIHPNMATMLAFVVTDAALPQEALREAWRGIVDRTFNQVTVDGDTSTNDLALVMANGAYGAVPLEAFFPALEAVARELARKIARDGEGATKLMTVRVVGAGTEEEARRAARTIAGSALWKSALYGNDPNWGRILAALGNSGARFDPLRVRIQVQGIPLYAGGALPFDRERASQAMRVEEVEVFVDLGEGQGEGVAWGCDLTEGYVKINALYTT